MSGSQLYESSHDSFPSLSQAITRFPPSPQFSAQAPTRSGRPAPPSHPPPSTVPRSNGSSASSSARSTLVGPIVTATSSAATGNSYAGWLNKVGGKIQTWKRRYCFIRDHQLCYAKQPTSAILHSLPLRGATLHMYQDANIHGNRKHLWGVAAVMDVFLPVQSATSCERLYLFQADSDADRDGWIQACLECQAMLFSPQAQAGDVLIQGWLQGTKKGYFVLTSASLSFYKTAPTSASVAADKVWKLTSSSKVGHARVASLLCHLHGQRTQGGGADGHGRCGARSLVPRHRRRHRTAARRRLTQPLHVHSAAAYSPCGVAVSEAAPQRVSM